MHQGHQGFSLKGHGGLRSTLGRCIYTHSIALALPAQRHSSDTSASPQPLPRHGKLSPCATEPAAPAQNCHHPERLLGQEAMWHLPDPDAITSMLLRAKPWQLPAPEGRGFLPLAPWAGQPAQPVPTPEDPLEGR